ncbi:MAG: hypothetical protein JWP31_2524, partial [Aeromicrobium sp.]|nr:hypothetical protein [Aeromicrobium sp.]
MPAVTSDSQWAAPVEHVDVGAYAWVAATGALSWDDRLARMFVASGPDETPAETWARRSHPDD